MCHLEILPPRIFTCALLLYESQETETKTEIETLIATGVATPWTAFAGLVWRDESYFVIS